MSALASFFSWSQPEPVFELEPATPLINPYLLDFAAMFAGDSIILIYMLLLVPALFLICVILPTRLVDLSRLSAKRPEIHVAWSLVSFAFGASLGGSWAFTDQGFSLRLWVPVYCFTFGIIPYLLQLFVVKFSTWGIPIATIIAWILVVETLFTIEPDRWGDNLFERQVSTMYLVLAEILGYAMQWATWSPYYLWNFVVFLGELWEIMPRRDWWFA
ncbi:hypothetical protein IL306_007237 [Fusarium sp. DS 682]|nr:hypothetical protein IL306_007237 [Fusarium sp. DS 682]